MTISFNAAISDFISYILQGWSLLQYRANQFSAATLVAYLGAGAVYLFSQKLGRIYVWLMSIIALTMMYTLSITPVQGILNMSAGEQAQASIPERI
ncbi:MAG: hypothetical protein WA131_01255 [Desulfitobacteriaceae bacterium]